jgi:hypothetical protein
MQRQLAGLVALAVLTLGSAAADESRKPAPAAEEPDAGFLEFLGSVDRLAEVNPDYLRQSDPRVARLNTRPRWMSPPPPPPPPLPGPPGAKHDE